MGRWWGLWRWSHPGTLLRDGTGFWRVSCEDFGFCQQFSCLVLTGEQRFRGERPLDADGRVVPQDAALEFRSPVISGLVQEFGRVAGDDETVSKALRYPQLALVFGGQGRPRPIGRRWRSSYGDRQLRRTLRRPPPAPVCLAAAGSGNAGRAAHFWRTWSGCPAQIGRDAGQFPEAALVEALIKKAAFITKYLRFEDENVGDRGGDDMHGQNTLLFNSCSK